MAEHEHKDEPILMTSPGRMTRGIIIVAVTLAIGAAVVVTQFDNFFSQAPPVTRLQPEGPETPPTAGVTKISILSGSSVEGNPDYDPDDAQVPIGNKVVWTNQDTIIHTATSGEGLDDPEKGARFDSGFVNSGESSPETEIDGEVGETIPYFCQLHPYMTSQLTLVEAGAGGTDGGGAAEGSTLTILAGSSVQGAPDYDPDPMTVSAGDVITVNNADNIIHTVTSGPPNSPDGVFDSSLVNPGESAEIDTAGIAPGEYDYFCIIHPYMVGKLQVE